MNNKRVVITGVGVIAANAIGKDAFAKAIFEGVSGIKPISLFDTAEFKAKTAGEVADFKPQDFLGDKGLRTLDRSTKLAASATKLAIDDSSLRINEENSRELGVSLGATFGSIASISNFDREALTDGPRYVNPGLFPNTVINSPASQVSIKFNIKGFNATISSAFCAGLDAIGYAADQIRLGRAKAVYSGGVEELCVQLFLGFYKAGCLAGLSGPEISVPFDKRRNGMILGEGACVLVLEDLDAALMRKADIYAEVLGFGRSFGPGNLGRAISLALKESGLNAADIDFVSSCANSTKDLDLEETRALKEVFGSGASKIQVSAVKSMLGECYSASGSLQVAAAIAGITRQEVFPTINYKEKDAECDLNYVVNKAKSCKINKALINVSGKSGYNSSLIISKYQ
ncbi:MAG: beta-ketoacyl-[acyl-carrier-protein] synthase family protein [Candidatus Omnitrophica bacterium]|nr:beta-ketoacyl-[acyl-carrier-protein] synthase family protein [Candidatus Omnitrophota bacterium]